MTIFGTSLALVDFEAYGVESSCPVLYGHDRVAREADINGDGTIDRVVERSYDPACSTMVFHVFQLMDPRTKKFVEIGGGYENPVGFFTTRNMSL